MYYISYMSIYIEFSVIPIYKKKKRQLENTIEEEDENLGIVYVCIILISTAYVLIYVYERLFYQGKILLKHPG